jgi:hypothetical protein
VLLVDRREEGFEYTCLDVRVRHVAVGLRNGGEDLLFEVEGDGEEGEGEVADEDRLDDL